MNVPVPGCGMCSTASLLPPDSFVAFTRLTDAIERLEATLWPLTYDFCCLSYKEARVPFKNYSDCCYWTRLQLCFDYWYIIPRVVEQLLHMCDGSCMVAPEAQMGWAPGPQAPGVALLGQKDLHLWEMSLSSAEGSVRWQGTGLSWTCVFIQIVSVYLLFQATKLRQKQINGGWSWGG